MEGLDIFKRLSMKEMGVFKINDNDVVQQDS